MTLRPRPSGVHAALELEAHVAVGGREVAQDGERAVGVGELALAQVERPGGVVQADEPLLQVIAAAPQGRAGELGGGAQGVQVGEVALEEDVEPGGGAVAADFLDLVGEEVRPFAAARAGCGRGGRARGAEALRVEQRAAGADLEAVEIARGLGEPDLTGQEGQFRLETAQLEDGAGRVGHVDGERQARAAQVERIEEGFLLDEVGQGDVDGDAVEVEQVGVLGVEQVEVGILGDKALEGIEREAAGGEVEAAAA